MKDATGATVHVRIVNKLMEAAKWLISVKTAKKEIFLRHQFVKAAKLTTVCSAKIKDSAKNVSWIITSLLYKIRLKFV
jgi:hypothetical protein